MVALVLAAAMWAGCAAPDLPKPPPRAFSAWPAEEQRIYEAVFQHMFAHWHGHAGNLPERFFLRIGSFDAPDDLLARLMAQGYTVAPAYRYRHGRGFLCSAEAIRFNSPTRATVRGGYLFGLLGGEWGPFILVKRAGEWRVVSWEADTFA
jgi:hypothetical protein